LDKFRRDITERWDAEPGSVESFICSKPRNFISRFVNSAHLNTLGRPLVYILANLKAYFTKAGLTSAKPDRIRWQVQLSHKIIDDINLGRIMNLKEVKGTIPVELKGTDNPQIVYKFSKTVGSKVLNYNNILKNTGTLSYQAVQDMQCECEGSEFKHPQLGHIITGDLRLIKDGKLRSICAKGTKFRETPYLDVSKIKQLIREDIDSISKKWATRCKIGNAKLKNWREAMHRLCLDKVDHLSKTKKYKGPILSNRKSKAELDRLRDSYVITVVDKAAGNFAFTCKKFYFLRLAGELGLDNITPGNETYAYTNETEQAICERICGDLAKFRITPNWRSHWFILCFIVFKLSEKSRRKTPRSSTFLTSLRNEVFHFFLEDV